ncbi:MAG TPA: hypothetical protein VKZ74_04050 [Natronosporangium sp.]|mgnify:CR=1 FL=1|nr:hypothetical protein [Natronosporangium sp.]
MGARRQDLPAFDVAVLGYDRRQVDKYVAELTDQLSEASRQLDVVAVLYAELCQAQVENDRLRRQSGHDPAWAEQLSTIMAAAEQLWSQAARDADAVRAQASPPTRNRRKIRTGRSRT